MNDNDGCLGEGIVILIFILFVLGAMFCIGYDFGKEAGYKECLDDARLGKPPKYKLVEVSKKWVRI